jgi:hypothetical protein
MKESFDAKLQIQSASALYICTNNASIQDVFFANKS